MARFSRLLVVTSLVALPLFAAGQSPEVNVNMVSGTQWPGGDPFLRQQNEGTIAVSTRNPIHLVGGSNDDRSVDVPFTTPPRPDEEETGEAWLSVYKSWDGGNHWISTLLDGYPQQNNISSPLNGFQAAADPIVRAANNGLFYYAGIVHNRGTNPASGVFIARFIDRNNTEFGDPIATLDQKMIDRGTSGQFVDKPWLAVAPMTNGGQCTVDGQTFPAQNVYLAYSILVGNDNNIRTKILITRSTDCGATWAMPQKLSETYSINQGVNIAVDPSNGNNVYVAWRRFQGGNDPNSVLVAKSSNAGASFTKAVVVANITPFDQGTTSTSIRTNAYPTIAVDNSGRVYVAWSQRDVSSSNDGRIVLSSSADGQTGWTAPAPIAPIVGGTSTGRGHQFMPTMMFSNGKLTLAWYDLRDDSTIAGYTLNPATKTYTQSRVLKGNLFLAQPQIVFWTYVSDASPDANLPLKRRHTVDVYATESTGLGAFPTFTGALRITRYKYGSLPPLYTKIEDIQINPPNLPMFRGGTVPFFGDYIDIASYVTAGANTIGNARVRHVVWTDDRDVRAPSPTPPATAPDWTKYTPVQVPTMPGTTSIFDPNLTRPICTVDAFGFNNAGSRNQNIYTTRVTDGLFAGSPSNAKPLGNVQHAFTIFVQNAQNSTNLYHLSFAQPLANGMLASFEQFTSKPTLDVNVPPHSTATRMVFLTGPAHTRVDVIVTQDGGALTAVISLNADPTNPDNPGIATNEIFNPEVANPEVANPEVANPEVANPEVANPEVANPEVANPEVANPEVANPEVANPEVANPEVANPEVANTDVGNQSMTDTSWNSSNEGNAAGGYTVKLFKLQNLPPGVAARLILNKTYDTPIARGCELGVEHHTQIVASIKDPLLITDPNQLLNPSLSDPSEKNATIWLAPGETGRITVRLMSVTPGLTLPATDYIIPVSISQAVNTADANGQNPTPSISLTILTASLPDGTVGANYNAPLSAIGGHDPKTWTATGLPGGLSVAGASITGTPQVAGTFPVTITVTDSAIPPHVKSKTLSLLIKGPKTFVVTNTNNSGAGSLRQAILDSNANQGFMDKIIFSVAGVISPTAALPGINDPAIIDATPTGICTGSAPTVQIDGFSAGVASGLVVANGGTTIRGLAITGFTSPDTAGIFFAGGSGSVVQCSYLGLALDGSAKGNYDGVRIAGSFNNTIGGTAAATRNVISGNLRNGVLLMGPTSGVIGSVMQTVVAGNFIGTDSTGTAARANAANGVQIINAADNTIGGTAAARNIISGNNGEGVRIDGLTATGNIVQGNYIGTKVSGVEALGNSASGVYIRRAPGNSVLGNLVSGNTGFAGVAICGNAAGFCGGGDLGTQGSDAVGNVVRGNLIGTDNLGTGKLKNNGYGVSIDGTPQSLVGGTAEGDGNVIAANGSDGVHIFGTSPDSNVIQGNAIGTDASGTLNLGNAGAGVNVLTGANNTISGTGLNQALNIIAFNGGAGISLAAGAGSNNLLRLNQIYSNKFGIDLGADGVTANDGADGDTGPNGLQNFPELTSVRSGGGTTLVDGTMQSTPNTQFTIDYFYSPSCDASGFGQGKTWFAGAFVTTNVDGFVSFISNVTITLPPGSVVTALATPSSGSDTSEFSQCVPVTTILAGNLQYPKGLFIKGNQAYLTETAGRNTSFGGRVRLSKLDVGTGTLTTLIDNPRNSDALVVSADDKIYLTSYHDTIPGQNGEVSVAALNGTWQEQALATIGIASDDMIFDNDGSNDLVIIGSSDQAGAPSLLRVLSPTYTQTQTIRTGLGRASSLTKVGGVTYYSVLGTGEVRWFSGAIDQVFISGATVVSLDNDGTWIYYAELGGGVKRKHITNGNVETVVSPSIRVNTVRWDAATSRLYYAEAGTLAGQYKDGSVSFLSIK